MVTEDEVRMAYHRWQLATKRMPDKYSETEVMDTLYAYRHLRDQRLRELGLLE